MQVGLAASISRPQFGSGVLNLFLNGTPGPATQGSAYSFTPSLGGGTGPYTVTLTAGSLPAGMSLDSATGAITGTPTTPGTSSGITLHAADSASHTTDLTGLSIVVSASGGGGTAGQPIGLSLVLTKAS